MPDLHIKLNLLQVLSLENGPTMVQLTCLVKNGLAKVKYFMKHVAKIDGSAQMHAFAV